MLTGLGQSRATGLTNCTCCINDIVVNVANGDIFQYSHSGAMYGLIQTFLGLQGLLMTGLQGTPILGAIVSDQYLGKYKTILYSAFIYVIGVFILFCTSLPSAIEHGAALGGLIAAMVKSLARGSS